MSLSFYGLWLLCALATTVFAAVTGGRVRELASMGAGLLLASAVVIQGWLPDAAVTGGVAAGVGAGYLWRPQWALPLAFVAGVIGGVWMSLLRVHGIPAPVGVTIVVSTAAVAATLARRRPEFAPELLREEALLAIALLGATVAAVPAVLDGWSAAANLTAFPGETSESVMPAWTLVLVAMALLTGAAHAMWSRR